MTHRHRRSCAGNVEASRCKQVTGHHLTEVEVEKEAPIFLLGPRVQDGEDPLLGPHLKKGNGK